MDMVSHMAPITCLQICDTMPHVTVMPNLRFAPELDAPGETVLSIVMTLCSGMISIDS